MKKISACKIVNLAAFVCGVAFLAGCGDDESFSPMAKNRGYDRNTLATRCAKAAMRLSAVIRTCTPAFSTAPIPSTSGQARTIRSPRRARNLNAKALPVAGTRRAAILPAVPLCGVRQARGRIPAVRSFTILRIIPKYPRRIFSIRT